VQGIEERPIEAILTSLQRQHEDASLAAKIDHRGPYLADPGRGWKSVRVAQAAESGEPGRVAEDVDAVHTSVDDGEAENGDESARLVAEDRRSAVEVTDDVVQGRRRLLLDGEEEASHRGCAAERSVERTRTAVAAAGVGGEGHVVPQEGHEAGE